MGISTVQEDALEYMKGTHVQKENTCEYIYGTHKYICEFHTNMCEVHKSMRMIQMSRCQVQEDAQSTCKVQTSKRKRHMSISTVHTSICVRCICVYVG